MDVLCGTDFSEPARAAVAVSAELARVSKGRLVLAYAVPPPHVELPELAPAWPFVRLLESAQAQIETLAGQLTEAGVQVEAIVESGSASQVLAALARTRNVALVVLGAIGRTGPLHVLVGSVVDRCAQQALVPVLAVREGQGLLDWLAGRRPLRVLAAIDESPESDAVVRWLSRLRELGPCDITATYVPFPPAVHLPLVPPDDAPTAARLAELEAQLRTRLSSVQGQGELTLRVLPSLGRADYLLAATATECASDLVVVGTHRRPWPLRLWYGSVSRGLLHLAPCSVLVAPLSA